MEENCFKDFGGNLFQRFWRRIVKKNLKENFSKILEAIGFNNFGGNLFQ